MHGGDVEQLQDDIKAELKRWHVDAAFKVDGEFGQATREMAKTVIYGLGGDPHAVDHGITPELRLLIRNRDLSPAQRKAFEAREDWRKRLAKRYARHGAQLAVEFAHAHLGVTEHPPGTNTGPQVSAWIKAAGLTPPAFWCGCFVNACLMAAGFPAQNFLVYCPNIEAHARAGIGGWKWHGPAERPQPGWLVLYTEKGIAGHVELVTGIQADGRPITIGGNTSAPGGGSQSNGGGVFEHKDRYLTGGFPIRGYAAPPYH